MNTRLSCRKKLCAICYETIGIMGQIDNCKHQFCFDCIKNWADKENSCPVCRANFKSIKRIKKRVYYNQKMNKNTSILVVNVQDKKQKDQTLLNIDQLLPFLLRLLNSISQE